MTDDTKTRIWIETVTIPTYGTGRPDKNPMFLEKRVYQGSSGAVYPYPVIDKILEEKTDQAYEAVFLENRWIKVMVLPQLGGRVHMALDKTNGVHFVYFAVSLPDFLVFDADLVHNNRIHCHYMMALGHLGLQQDDRARAHLEQVLRLDQAHLGVCSAIKIQDSGVTERDWHAE